MMNAKAALQDPGILSIPLPTVLNRSSFSKNGFRTSDDAVITSLSVCLNPPDSGKVENKDYNCASKVKRVWHNSLVRSCKNNRIAGVSTIDMENQVVEGGEKLLAVPALRVVKRRLWDS